MFQTFRSTHQHTYVYLGIGLITLFFAACGTSTSVPQPVQRGQWQRPVFQNISLPTVSAVAFTEANPQIGYVCAATLKSGVATPTATGTQTTALPTATQLSTATPLSSPTATATITATASATAAVTPSGTITSSPTPTVGIPGRPTPLPSSADIANSFWSTQDGGLTWQGASLPHQENVICPLSAISAPDLDNPQDIFLLLASGNFDLTNPIAISPDQIHYSLWRSVDGGSTWNALAVPSLPNPIVPVVMSPYHITMTMQGQTLLLGSVYPENTILFASTNGGTSWNYISAQSVQKSAADTTQHSFVSFAPAYGTGILALMSSPAIAGSDAPYELWKSSSDGMQWTFVNTVPVKGGIPANGYAQVFASPIAHTVTVIAQQYATLSGTSTPTAAATPAAPSGTAPPATATAAPISTSSQAQAALFHSADDGTTWSSDLWPSSTTNGSPLGGALIATYGLNCVVLGNGDTYFAPTNSDAATSQNPQAGYSAGIYRTTSHSTDLIAQPVDSTRTVIGMNISFTPMSVILGTPLATQTPAPTSAATVTGTATAGATGTAVTPTATTALTPTTVPTSTEVGTVAPTSIAVSTVPTIWANFGPLQNLAQNTTSIGLYQYILP